MPVQGISLPLQEAYSSDLRLSGACSVVWSAEGYRVVIILEASLEQDCVILGSDEVIDGVRENKNVHILTCPRQGEENIFRTLSGVYLSNLVFKIGYGMIIIPYEELDDWSSHDMAALMARNVAVYVSGVNGQEAFMAVKDLPVSGIITANPQLMFELRAVTDTTEI